MVDFFQIYLHNALNINDLLQLPCHGLSHGLRVSEPVDVTVSEINVAQNLFIKLKKDTQPLTVLCMPHSPVSYDAS